MEKKKLVALLGVITLALALVLSACASTAATATKSAAPSEPILLGISAEPSTVTLAVNDTQQLTIRATFSEGPALDVTSTCSAYNSNNPKVAAITEAGLINGVGVGTATITVVYTKNNQADSVDIPVTVR